MKQDPQVFSIINKILLAVVLCVMAGQQYITFLKHEEKFESPVKFIMQNCGNDYISQYSSRFEEIKKMFPQPAHLSYIGEVGEDFATGWYHYVLTQYYLSPNLVFKEVNKPDTIIYNLYNTRQMDPVTNFHLSHGWHVIKDFNNGLIILAK